jgi:uracil-DNA glycosylase family 4
MRPRDLTRYCRDIGWTDPPVLAGVGQESAEPQSRPRWETLDDVAQDVEACVRCRLASQRRNVVVGEGDIPSPVMFIGEGPGSEEDRTGRPFVGQAGMLLDGMIFALGFERRQVYIGNVVKCRPPGNRDPEDDEMAACAPYLERQIELVQPRVIVALGRVAARRLTGSTKPMSALRGRWTSYRGIPLLPTFHPAYLLRSPAAKREVWQDLKAVRARLREGSPEPSPI